MREIESVQIARAVQELVQTAAVDLEPDILDALIAARDRESSPLSKNVLDLLLINADIASREQTPVCQDTGTGVIFISLGQDVFVRGDMQAAVQDGVREGYREGYLRMSVCDPLTRRNTGTNTPAVVHVDFMPGDRVKIAFLPKGCGSENMSALAMLPPSSGLEGVVDFVVDRVIAAGPNPCPPVIVGVGIGGNFEMAALLAKKALLRTLGDRSPRSDVAELEETILREVNAKGCGVQGFGGDNTALAVHIETFPSHIASLPVAVNIQCHAHRHKEIVI